MAPTLHIPSKRCFSHFKNGVGAHQPWKDNRRSSGSVCSMCDGNASGLGFREGFCEVTSLLRPGW